MSKEIKINKKINANEISSFLRELADTFDGQKEAFDIDVRKHLQNFSKIEINIKKNMLLASVKMKMEQGEPIEITHKKLMNSQAAT
ncbi:MAG: hypothetical protein FP814_11290 [Desulfobacterium sp.]|nr:hypothetical protein [Desulfobacterium sp.]MBU3947314.1 hypothetical protein [Pseudomonadota bacterium]MBU4037050.1 hypothetical protein [Pseudomonadota bacterium]